MGDNFDGVYQVDYLETVGTNQYLICKLEELISEVGVLLVLERGGYQILDDLFRKVKGWQCVSNLLLGSIIFQADTSQCLGINLVADIEEASAYLLLNFEVLKLSVNREQRQIKVGGIVNLVD